MSYRYDLVTGKNGFWENTDPAALAACYGTPLYIYNERILRERCREMRELVRYPNFHVNYSAKANTNLTLLRIAREEGLYVDAMSLGEIAIEEAAGFSAEQIFFVSNNVSREEMAEVIRKGIHVSVDAVSQLEMYGQLCPGGEVCVRLNTGVGAGHNEKVVTGGHETKFAVDPDQYDEMMRVIGQYGLHLTGINQHIGSQFMTSGDFLEGTRRLLEVCKGFPELKMIDLGGGFGIPYHKADGEGRLDLAELGAALDELFAQFAAEYGREVEFRIEPGRYVVAESCVLLGKVHTVKTVFENRFAGTDLGFNVLVRPVMYGSWHDVEIYRADGDDTGVRQVVSVVGNICESGDAIASKRELPEILEGDLIGVMDAGAYGYSMSSNYNSRLRPAEVMITTNGEVKLIRRRDCLEDLLRGFETC